MSETGPDLAKCSLIRVLFEVDFNISLLAIVKSEVMNKDVRSAKFTRQFFDIFLVSLHLLRF